ncbi:F-box/kelch-repeat protein At3g23880-like [Spinacia oleracea]|uniref:F-box/kelch-repeat protein At3g23880-like n=1 Tax=Spinacia oleracea TaxID=3562 RepID=A0ABM3RFH7_SPIOL|nr:F-box/kelch-repeat protein At3g23880-like [Spinacia oleracea]
MVVEGGRWKIAANYDIIIDGCLPPELTLEILLRLPVKSLLNFKLVCKSWNSLICSPDFIKSHTRNSNNPSLTLLYDRDFMELYSLNPTVSQVDLTPQYYPYSEFIGSCDGLICIYSPRKECIYILNPLTNETKKISTPYHEPDRMIRVSWFGFDPSINDYMIWLVVGIRKRNLRIHVYSTKDDNWRELDTSVFIFIDDCMFWGMNVVVMNETLHCWLGNDYNNFMVKYNLVKDIIEIERINLNYNQDIKYSNEPSIGILQDSSLCLCKVNGINGVMDVWKLDQYSNSDFWNKLFRLDLGLPKFVTLLGFTSNGRILVKSSSYELVLVDPNQNPPLQVRLGTIDYHNDRCRSFDLLDYSESLVSPFSLP